MNIDLIIKLARLANENPNENEANAAAKKVCSLIKAGDYKFTNQPIANRQQPINREPVRSNRQPDVRSANNPKSDPFRNYPFDDIKWDNFSWFDEILKDRARSGFNPSSGKDERFYKDPMTDVWKQKEKEKRILKCKTCKKDIETSFVGLAEIFECNDCSWSEWERKRDIKV